MTTAPGWVGAVQDWSDRPAAQQPDWADDPALPAVREALASVSALVTAHETDALGAALAGVARGGGQLLQLGDCAESFDECTPAHVAAKLDVLEATARRLARRVGAPVVPVGRIGGQFAKPRSLPTEVHDGVVLPAFRGHLINSEVPDPVARRADPLRMLRGCAASAEVLGGVRERAAAGGSGIWASHEALVLDYERSLVRTERATGKRYLTSTHLPWIGDRTRQPGFGHVQLLAEVANPVACKIGPTATADEVVALCACLDPDRIPGRLVLILRLGVDAVDRVLPAVATAVRRAGHPVVWLSDPMHGNTVRTRSGGKTRRLTDIVDEAVRVRRVLEALGLHAGGLHVEVAATDVLECVDDGEDRADALRSTSLCDPRLAPRQAWALVDAWSA